MVEVHLSNVHRREEFRHRSFVSPQATAVIAGAGAYGYVMAVDFLAQASGGIATQRSGGIAQCGIWRNSIAKISLSNLPLPVREVVQAPVPRARAGA